MTLQEISNNQELESEIALRLGLPLVRDVLDRMERELPKSVYYHRAKHTRDVISESLMFAWLSQVRGRELDLIMYAALYHDLGFIVDANGHEGHSQQLVRVDFEQHNLGDEGELNQVCQMIADTKLKLRGESLAQIPSTKLSPYLLDADMSNLGRADFFDCAELILQESKLDGREFWPRTLGMLRGHQWHCQAARDLRTEGLATNIEILDQRLLKS